MIFVVLLKSQSQNLLIAIKNMDFEWRYFLFKNRNLTFPPVFKRDTLIDANFFS